MGEAVYYGKITFNGITEAQEAMEPFKALLLDIYNASEFWQKNRGSFTPADLSQDEFWIKLEEYHPLAAKYLKTMPSIWGHDRNNPLAGLLDVLGHPDDLSEVHLYDNEIRWSSEVWHFADWGPFINYVVDTFAGATRGGSLSDEYVDVDYFTMI